MTYIDDWKNVHRWESKTTYYDTDTGEQLSYQKVKRDYKIIKSTKTTTINGKHGKIEITKLCQSVRQSRLWD